MTRILKTSGFLGLATMMSVGLYQFVLLEGSGGAPPAWFGGLVGGHVHLGVLSILAIVMGFAVDSFDLADRLRRAVSGLYLAGQWGLPLTIWVGLVGGYTVVMPTAFVWGLCLILSMLIMAWQAWTRPTAEAPGAPGAAPADD